MAFNGSGTFVRVHSWETDRNNDVKIEAERMDDEDDGFATGLSNCITKDGQTTITASIPFNGQKITGLGDAAAAGDAVSRSFGDARYHPIGATTTTDEAIARYNGVAGATQNSGVTIDDSNNVAGMATLTLPNTGLHLLDTNASHDLIIAPGSDLSADRTLTLTTGDASRTLTMTGNLSMSGAFNLTLTTTADTDVTLPTTGTLATLAGAETLTNKTITGGTATALTGLAIRSTGSGAFDLTFANTEDLTAGRTLTYKLNDAARTVNLGGNITTAAAFVTSGANSLTLTTTGATNVTLPTTGTLATLAGTETLSGKTLDAPIITNSSTSRSTDASASTFTAYAIDRNSATPANNDFIGKMIWTGRDNGANLTTYAEIDAQITDVTDTSEDGKIVIRTMNAGSLVDTATIDNGGLTLASGLSAQAGRFFTSTVTIADDNVTILSAPTSAGMLMVSNTGSPGATRPFGIIAYRASGVSVAPATVAWNDATNVAYTTGVLAGTTGANDKLTFSCNNNGNIYVENRLGASITFNFTFIG